MTTVRVDLRQPDGSPAAGSLTWVPTRRLTTAAHILLPAPFSVALAAGVANVAVVATDDPAYPVEWAWKVTEHGPPGVTTRHVLVPTSGSPLEYAALQDVDPATLDPTAQAPAAWTVALQGPLDLIQHSPAETPLRVRRHPAAELGGDANLLEVLNSSGQLVGYLNEEGLPRVQNQRNGKTIWRARNSGTGVTFLELTNLDGSIVHLAIAGDGSITSLGTIEAANVGADTRLLAAFRLPGKHETISRLHISAVNTAITSGTLYLHPIWLPAGTVVSNITFVSGNAALAGGTHQWYGLLDQNRVALAFTSNDGANPWPTNTAKTLPIATTAAGAASSYTTTYTGVHYLGLMVAAATPPNMCGGGIIAVGASSQTPAFGAANTGLTTPPTFPFTANAPGGSNGFLGYAYTG
ncbi:MAG: hypothetical protein L0Y54_10010 [Sporichthyaceae bacterium]|nr:hypothetical protein [Sporichthyaceae bacterium]